MHRIVYMLFLLFLLQIGSVPSGLKINSIRVATGEQYPFIVSLERLIRIIEVEKVHVLHLCTCAVLTPSWTLTAGHCIESAVPTLDITDNIRIKFVIRYGSLNGITADIISIILQNSFRDPLLKNQNDIGLIRTEAIHLKQYAEVSPININDLGDQEVFTIAGFKTTNNNSSLRTTDDFSYERKPLQILNVVVVRYDSKDNSTIAAECVGRRCIPSLIGTCPADSGGPMLHSTGIIGINSISLENVKLCSETNENQLIGMGIITPTRPHLQWITYTVNRDDK